MPPHTRMLLPGVLPSKRLEGHEGHQTVPLHPDAHGIERIARAIAPRLDKPLRQACRSGLCTVAQSLGSCGILHHARVLPIAKKFLQETI